MDSTQPFVWRSLLYVPANNDRFIDKAHTRDADAIILDLEDSVPSTERPGARSVLEASMQSAGRGGADVLVRVNRQHHELEADIEAAVMPGVCALVVPKVESPDRLRMLSRRVEDHERALGMRPGTIRFVVLVETPEGLLHVADIAKAVPRSAALALGGEDFAAAAGSVPDAETLAVPRQLALYAARAAGLAPLGLMGTVHDYRDQDRYLEIVRRSRRFGFEGATCIHPSAVPILNEGFSPSAEEVADARRVVEAYAEATTRGSGAITVDGEMVDVPIAERAKSLLRRYDAIRRRQSKSGE